MRKSKKVRKVLISSTIVIVIMILINFIPTWNRKTKNMKVFEGDWVDVYYQKEADAARDVYELADSQAQDVATKLGFSDKQDVNIFIYDKQSTMQAKKYGYIIPMLNLDWYIGDNIGTDVILTSPANPGKVHDYKNNKYAALHEMVHAYVSVINPKISLWLTEGMALYMTNGITYNKDYYESVNIPSYKDIQTKNPIKFTKIGGYNLAHTYIEYLDVTYGWDKVLDLLKSQNYEEVFDVSGKEIYKNWVEYLIN